MNSFRIDDDGRGIDGEQFFDELAGGQRSGKDWAASISLRVLHGARDIDALWKDR